MAKATCINSLCSFIYAPPLLIRFGVETKDRLSQVALDVHAIRDLINRRFFDQCFTRGSQAIARSVDRISVSVLLDISDGLESAPVTLVFRRLLILQYTGSRSSR